jgi:myo-inositol 2-dehydrogenase/D-chiro-inositol 1-dehydrogenase
MNDAAGASMPRRTFLKSAAAATAAFTIVRPRAVRGSDANGAVEVGIIGSGYRGVWLGGLCNEHTKLKPVALMDVFDWRLKLGQEKLGVPDDRCYKGLDAYHDLLGSGVDAVLVESPPYFHPIQAAAAVDAGKHVYVAKPIAVDVPGCHQIVAAGEKAEGKVVFLVDFQTRANAFYQESAKRVFRGDIGTPVCAQVFYHASRLGAHPPRDDDQRDAFRVRNWVFDKVLSGDIIVEQNIHCIDVANWYLQNHPTHAFGTGGRKARTDVGDTWDHFVCTFWYPDDVVADFGSTQFLKGFAYKKGFDICARIFGTKGTVDSHYEGRVAITGDNAWEGGVTEKLFTTGAVENLKTFEKRIRTSDNKENNAKESATSTLTCILGRTAAYKQRVVTWDEIIKANEKWNANIRL